jgi:hypothetical protein
MENGYPELHSFARNKAISTKEFYAQQHRPDLFSLPLVSRSIHIASYKQHNPSWNISLNSQLTMTNGHLSGVNNSQPLKHTYRLFLIGHRNVHQVYKSRF